MAGLDNNMLALIRSLAENRIQDAKKAAIACCVNDTTQRNQSTVGYYKKLLTNGNTKLFEMPANLTGLLNMQDVSDFREERYYLDDERTSLFSQIKDGVEVTLKLLEYGISYRNSTLLQGEAGTGKTEFAKYVAFKLGLPYAYINFSSLIDSCMGKTSQNLQRIFDYCKGQKCVLMLDEIDCIGLARGKDGGCDGELGRTTISLMQALDNLVDGQIIIAATNRVDRLDAALLRRFQRKCEFKRYDADNSAEMVKRFINDIDICFLEDDLLEYARVSHTQAEIITYMIECIAETLLKKGA